MSVFHSRSLLLITLLVLLVSGAAVAAAQDAPVQPGSAVTHDDVNAVARRMYCPECENIPLDKCLTPVCMQWKGEIADQLAAGRSPEQIYTYFRDRFGDQVLAVPQDPFLRGLSLAGPYVLAGVMLLLGVVTLLRLRGRDDDEVTAEVAATGDASSDPYRSRLERDLNV
jgi:cytochrome c-type biogenesis protein CcmH